MSKIAETKALEEYPEEKHITYGIIPGGNPFEIDINTRERNGYIKGYDQAMQDLLKDANQYMYLSDEIGYAYACGCRKTMQDFLEKTCEWLKSYRQEASDKTGYIAGIVNDETIEQFKKYMQDE